LECDQENILNAKIGELYNGEICKWRVLQRKTVKSNFTVQNYWRNNIKSNISIPSFISFYQQSCISVTCKYLE
jgi:hypothetical protein